MAKSLTAKLRAQSKTRRKKIARRAKTLIAQEWPRLAFNPLNRPIKMLVGKALTARARRMKAIIAKKALAARLRGLANWRADLDRQALTLKHEERQYQKTAKELRGAMRRTPRIDYSDIPASTPDQLAAMRRRAKHE